MFSDPESLEAAGATATRLQWAGFLSARQHTGTQRNFLGQSLPTAGCLLTVLEVSLKSQCSHPQAEDQIFWWSFGCLQRADLLILAVTPTSVVNPAVGVRPGRHSTQCSSVSFPPGCCVITCCALARAVCWTRPVPFPLCCVTGLLPAPPHTRPPMTESVKLCGRTLVTSGTKAVTALGVVPCLNLTGLSPSSETPLLLSWRCCACQGYLSEESSLTELLSSGGKTDNEQVH